MGIELQFLNSSLQVHFIFSCEYNKQLAFYIPGFTPQIFFAALILRLFHAKKLQTHIIRI